MIFLFGKKYLAKYKNLFFGIAVIQLSKLLKLKRNIKNYVGYYISSHFFSATNIYRILFFNIDSKCGYLIRGTQLTLNLFGITNKAYILLVPLTIHQNFIISVSMFLSSIWYIHYSVRWMHLS